MSLRLQAIGRARVSELLPLFADANYRQTWSYADAAARRIGARSEWFEASDEVGVVALANVRVKAIPFGLGGIALVSGGPLVRRVGDAVADHAARHVAALRQMLDALRDEFVQRRGMTLRIHGAIGDAAWNSAQRIVLAEAGFALGEGGNPYRTILKRIDGTEADLRRSFAQKWRNQLNAAERQGLTIESGADRALFDRFDRLFQHTRDQKGFSVDLDLGFFREVREKSLAGEPLPWITLVKHGDADVSGHLGMYAGETGVYLLGGTNDDGRQTKAAYLAQWAAIQHARSLGCAWYDTGGIDPVANPGVFHFKDGLEGLDVVAAGPAEACASGSRAALTRLAERFYAARR
ncbi:MAG: peptidoglycan bridge formation glycyltransferase FemA/FemB family protein [Phycisphaerales bacterium]